MIDNNYYYLDNIEQFEMKETNKGIIPSLQMTKSPPSILSVISTSTLTSAPVITTNKTSITSKPVITTQKPLTSKPVITTEKPLTSKPVITTQKPLTTESIITTQKSSTTSKPVITTSKSSSTSSVLNKEKSNDNINNLLNKCNERLNIYKKKIFNIILITGLLIISYMLYKNKLKIIKK